jgi:hypothetical protein
MEAFVQKVANEIKGNTRQEIDGCDPATTTIVTYARAHGYRYHYDSKYLLGVASAINRPELNMSDSIAVPEVNEEEVNEEEEN